MKKRYAARQNTNTEKRLAEITSNSETIQISVTLEVQVPMGYLFNNPTEGFDNLAYLHKHLLEGEICKIVTSRFPEKIAEMEGYWKLNDELFAVLHDKNTDQKVAQDIFNKMKGVRQNDVYHASLIKIFANNGVTLE